MGKIKGTKDQSRILYAFETCALTNRPWILRYYFFAQGNI